MKTPVITEEFIIVSTISHGIHKWLHEMGDEINKYTVGLNRVHDIGEVVKKCIEDAKKIIRENQDRLNGNVPSWIATAMLDEGYGKQCISLKIDAETKEEAQELAEQQIAELFKEKPNAEIFEVKVKKTT
jgi:hypothetical protein